MLRTRKSCTLVAATALGIWGGALINSASAQNQQDQQGPDLQGQQSESSDATNQQRNRNDQNSQQQDDQGQRQNQPDRGDQSDERTNREMNRDRQQDASRDQRNFREQDRGQQTRRDQQDRQRGDQQRSDAPAGLGVSVIDGDRGLLVREVAPDSPAQQAGIRRGDEILSVNGSRVNDGDQLVQMISQENPGSEVEVEIDRNGQQQIVVANLETRREALQFENRQAQDRGRMQQQQQRRYGDQFAGGSPPWDSQDVHRHVDALEQQVRRMQREIQDLRQMLQDDPSQRRFNQETVRTQSGSDSRMNRSQNQQQSDFDRDQQNRARPNYDNNNDNDNRN